ncbi:MAG TPA: acylphosphatase [Actinomycetota bacterium]
MTRRVHVLVSGQVQGVFFRASCGARARELGVAGYVRNLPDGRVEAAFEGPSRDVDAMIAWCRRGPDRAEVEDVEVTEELSTGEEGFRVSG